MTQFSATGLAPRARLHMLAFAVPLSFLFTLPAYAYTYETTSTGIPLHWTDQNTATPGTIDIFYDFRDTNGYANVMTPAEQTLFVTALNDWSTISGGKLVFTQSTTLPESAIINLGVSDLASVGGVSGGETLGLTSVYSFSNGTVPQAIVRLDSAQTWDTTIGNGNPADPAPDVDFYSVALHEIGHALGMNHTDTFPQNIMTTDLLGEKLGPSVDDINGIDNLYGVDPSTHYNDIARTMAAVTVGSPFDGPRFFNYFEGDPSVFHFYTDTGTTTVTGALSVREGATFHMAGGAWTANSLAISDSVGNTGSFEMSAGSFTASTMTLNPGGVLTLSGGSLAIDSITTFGSATINLSGGGLASRLFSNKAAINWTGGTLSIVSGGGLPLGVIAVPAAGILKTTGRISLTTFTVNGQAQFLRNGTSQNDSTFVNLNIAGAANAWTGKIDLNDNFININAANSTSKLTTLATLNNQIKSGLDSGDWLGNGITSSTAAADPTHLGVGLFDNAILGKAFIITPNIPLTTNSILIAQAPLGDANDDGTVNAADLSILRSNWHTSVNDWTHGDLNYDGFVDSLDVGLLVSHWTAASFSPVINYTAGFSYTLVAAVPEPASLSLLAIAFPFMLCRRRKIAPPV